MAIMLTSASSQYGRVSLRSLGLREANNTLAIGGMFYYNGTPANAPYMFEYGTATNSGIRFAHDITGNKLFSSSQVSGANYIEDGFTSRDEAAMAGSWHTWTVVVGADRNIKLWVDGVQGTRLTGTTVPAANASIGQYLSFGGRYTPTASTYLNGRLAECYYCAGFIPTDEQVAKLHTRVRPDLMSGFTPTAYWPLLTDANAAIGGSNYNWTLGGSPTFDSSSTIHPHMNDGSWTRVMTWW